MSSIENLSSKSCPKEALSVVGTKQQVETNSADKWALVTTNNGGATRPVRAVEGCVSPNGFQLLQDMREEGEIDEEEQVEEVGSEVEEEVVNLEVSATSVIGESRVAGNQEDRNKVTLLADSIEDDESNTGAVATKKQSSAARGRGRGAKRPIKAFHLSNFARSNLKCDDFLLERVSRIIILFSKVSRVLTINTRFSRHPSI
ncbi:hypothetical protein YC2023_122785 [Brassica napus]